MRACVWRALLRPRSAAAGCLAGIETGKRWEISVFVRRTWFPWKRKGAGLQAAFVPNPVFPLGAAGAWQTLASCPGCEIVSGSIGTEL